jgi:hypothetical protein
VPDRFPGEQHQDAVKLVGGVGGVGQGVDLWRRADRPFSEFPGSALLAKPPSSAGEHCLDVRQVRDRLDMAAGAGCSPAVPVTSRGESR